MNEIGSKIEREFGGRIEGKFEKTEKKLIEIMEGMRRQFNKQITE